MKNGRKSLRLKFADRQTNPQQFAPELFDPGREVHKTNLL